MQFSTITMDKSGVGSGVNFLKDINDNLPKLIGVGSVGSIHLLNNISENYGGKLRKIIQDDISDKAINSIINFSDPQYNIYDEDLSNAEIHNKYFLNAKHKEVFNFRGFF